MKKRSDGRFKGSVYIGTVNGKNQYKYVYGQTQKEVKQKIAELKVKLGKGETILTGSQKTFSHWAELWLEKEKDSLTKERWNTQKSRLEPFIKAFGHCDLTEINTADIERVLKSIEKKNPNINRPTAKKTLIEYRSVVSNTFDYAIQNRVIEYNPTNYVQISKTAKKGKRNAISDMDIDKIRNSDSEMTLPAMLMLYAGLRRGELCALTWNDIDFSNKIIHVTKSLNFKTQEVKEPKTEAGHRDIPILNILYEYLITVPKTSILVVTHDGKQFTEGAWKCSFNNFCKEIGIETSAHCLRHTFATLLFEADVDIYTTKEVMGHEDISTTRTIYTHLRDNQRQKSLDKLNKYLAK